MERVRVVVSGDASCTSYIIKVLARVCIPTGFPKNYFRHQQSHSVALPNLFSGHNNRGFVGTIEWFL